jgi:hypothetical protein
MDEAATGYGMRCYLRRRGGDRPRGGPRLSNRRGGDERRPLPPRVYSENHRGRRHWQVHH